MSALPAPVAAILDALEEPGLRERERVLRATLNPAPSAATRRVLELGELARLLNSHGARHWLGFQAIPRETYDEERGEGAPTSGTLVERFHTWLEACRAAGGLLEDGRYRGEGRPWPQRRGVLAPAFIEADCLDAIRACKRELGHEPSSNEYAIWCRAKREAARRTGAETLPPR